ncbi:unnamed protein product, partial [marine sediment metagenome]
MGKTLRKIIFSSIIAGSLLLPSCGVKDISKKASDAITGEENAYDKALDIAKKLLLGYLSTKDDSGKSVFSQLREEENLNNFNG